MTGGAAGKARPAGGEARCGPKRAACAPGSPAAGRGSFHPAVAVPGDEIAAFCGRWGVAELSLFGSALRSDFRPESDVDLLVRFAPGKEHGLLAFSRMQRELEAIFGRPVDLVAETAVERSENRIKRRHILETRVVIHATG